MRHSIRSKIVSFAGSLLVMLPLTATASDDSKDQAPPQTNPAQAPGSPAADRAKDGKLQAKDDKKVPEMNLLDAMRAGLVSAKAEGIGDGRMTLSVTNRSKHQLRVVLPPGIIAQSATGQFGGMGGMGGGMGGMGGGMGGMGGGMGGMMGGMGGGMGGGGMGGQGGMGGMGGMGRTSGTMPPTMGMMMLSRMIMYFCGDPDSWDMRSLMIGMMGGMGGGMGGMGGGMGGMGGGMGGMGGGMRSVPPAALPSAVLNAGQTRHLPTRLVSISSPDPQVGVSLPEKGERLRIAGDVADVNDDVQVHKALRRLTAEMAPTSVVQLVMWRLTGKLDWETIAVLSEKWANDYELTLAKDFVTHLDTLPDAETGRLLIQADGKDAAGEPIAAELTKLLQGKTVLGLVAQVGEIPSLPDGPAVSCRVRISGKEALVQVSSSDAQAKGWVNFGKFSVPVAQGDGKADVVKLADGLSEGILNRLVRAQIIKNSATKDKGKLVYQLRIDNASPLVLRGLAMLGTSSKEGEIPKVLPMISVSPRKSLTVPTNEDVVRNLGLKKGVKLIALDLGGL
jgi:hypothetical protein